MTRLWWSMQPFLPFGLSPIPYNQFQLVALQFDQRPQACLDIRDGHPGQVDADESRTAGAEIWQTDLIVR